MPLCGFNSSNRWFVESNSSITVHSDGQTISGCKTLGDVWTAEYGLSSCSAIGRNQGIVDTRTKDIRTRLSRKMAIRENVANLVRLMEKVDQTDPDQKRIYDMYATRKAGLEQMLVRA
jgi:hypothetical protein